MKYIRLIVIIYGFITALVLPLLHVLSTVTRYEIISFKDYIIAFLLFIVLYQYVERSDRHPDRNSLDVRKPG